MISPKLLSEVLGVFVRPTFYIDCETLIYEYDKIKGLDECYKGEINVHELAHKCKEWAYSKEYLLDSRVTTSGSCFLHTSPISEKEDINKTFTSKTEPEAIFKACEWIKWVMEKTTNG